MKPFSYNGDAREWNEESVENLRHESSKHSKERVGGPSGDRRNRRQAFGIIVSYKGQL